MAAWVVLLVAVLGPPLAAPSYAALPATNGALLLGDQLVDADGSQHQIKVPGTTTTEFSPDGGRIAGVTLGNVVKLWSADGTDRTLATLPQTVRDVTWASDGSSVAALTGDFGDHPHSIYVVSLATGVVTPVYADASDHRINLENGLSWQPGGSKLLFTANLPFDAGTPNASITQQLFTVPASGGSATQFFVPSALPTDPQYRFGTPEWAPDGIRIAVWVQEDGSHSGTPYEDDYLSVMIAGVVPTQLRSVHVAHPAFAGPYWSTDGAALLYSDVPAGPGPAPATVVSGSSGGLLGTYAYGGQVTDWQPCPAGSCVVWGLHAARTSTLTSSASKVAKGKKVTLSGQVVAGGLAVCSAGQQVDVQRQKTGKKTFAHLVAASTDAAGRFRLKIKVKASAHYRVVLSERPDCLAATSPPVKVKVAPPKGHK